MYRLMQNGEMVALGENLRYIRMQENGSYGFCPREEAQGVAMDSKPYHLEGMAALAGAETVSMEVVESKDVVSDFQAAALVFAGQADVGAIDDATISLHPDLFPRLLENGSLVKIGTHINWHGTVKVARVDLWDTEVNNPDNAPDMWDDISYRDGYRVIPENIVAENPFAEGECGWWEDMLYRSKIPANVWTPAQHAAGWEVVNP